MHEGNGILAKECRAKESKPSGNIPLPDHSFAEKQRLLLARKHKAGPVAGFMP